MTIKMTIGDETRQIELYENTTTKAVVESLPYTIRMSRWGNGEYYGSFSEDIPPSGKQTTSFKRGEVALWPDGNGFCIFFDRTPVSTDDTPKMASPGTPLGMIQGDISFLKKLGGSITAKLEISQ